MLHVRVLFLSQLIEEASYRLSSLYYHCIIFERSVKRSAICSVIRFKEY